jgi:O-antigen/teichoic acid export membrane protein
VAGTAAAPAPERSSSYGRGARVLAVGIGVTGLVTFAFFSLSSYAIGQQAYGQVATLWTVLFIAMTVLYRPVEQLLSRSIAQASAVGTSASLRTPALLQLGFAAIFLVGALAAREPLEDALGSATLFWILVGAALAYAVSYFARGYVAGRQLFALYGLLVLFEALVRVLFPLAVVVGVASGQTVVALGIVAAPLASLLVIPWLVRRRSRGAEPGAPAGPGTAAAGGAAAFAGSVALIQLAEQTLLNGAVLFVGAGATAGIVFNAFLITRVPLQLFQSVQTSLLPHLAGTTDRAAFARAIRRTVLVMAALAGAVVVGLLVLGPWAMDIPFDDDVTYGRWGLAAIALGMGFHLVAGTFNQAALARGHAHAAAAAWVAAGLVFVAWLVAIPVDDDLVRAQTGYLAAAALLALLLAGLYRLGSRTAAG